MLESEVQWSSVAVWHKYPVKYPVHHTTCSNTRQQLTKICHKNKSWIQSPQLEQLSNIDTLGFEFKLKFPSMAAPPMFVKKYGMTAAVKSTATCLTQPSIKGQKCFNIAYDKAEMQMEPQNNSCNQRGVPACWMHKIISSSLLRHGKRFINANAELDVNLR